MGWLYYPWCIVPTGYAISLRMIAGYRNTRLPVHFTPGTFRAIRWSGFGFPDLASDQVPY